MGLLEPKRMWAKLSEIVAARGGEADLGTRLDGIDTNVTAVTNEVTAARGGEVNLDTRLDGIDTNVTAVTNEVTAARGGEVNLDTRLDGIDTDVTAVAAGGRPNLVWDPFNQYFDDTVGSDPDSWNSRARWSNVGGTVTVEADVNNPYNLPSLKGTSATTRINRRLYLDEMGLRPGDVVSAAVLAYAATGSYYGRITWRNGSGTSLGTTSSATIAMPVSFEPTTFPINAATIPASCEIIDLGLWYASGTNAEKAIYAMWLTPGSTAPTWPSATPNEAFLRSQLGDNIAAVDRKSQVLLRELAGTAFAVQTPWPVDDRMVQWRFEENATTGLFMHDAVYLSTVNGSVVGSAILAGDIGFTMSFTPSGESTQLAGNNHNNMYVTAVTIEDDLGVAIDTENRAYHREVNIINQGYIRHPDTGATNHAEFSYVIQVRPDGVYGTVHLKSLVSNLRIDYLNAGQLVFNTLADYGAVEGNFPVVDYDAGGGDVAHDGATVAWVWDTATDYAARVESYNASTMVVRETTMKIYPRSVQAGSPVTLGVGDCLFASWKFSLHQGDWSKRFVV